MMHYLLRNILVVLLLLLRSSTATLLNETLQPGQNHDECSLLQSLVSLKRQPISPTNASEPDVSIFSRHGMRKHLPYEQPNHNEDLVTTSSTFEPLKSRVQLHAVSSNRRKNASRSAQVTKENMTQLTSLLPSSWLCLGPFNIRDYGSDPLRAFGSIQDIANRVPAGLWDEFHIRSTAFDEAVKNNLGYQESLKQVMMTQGNTTNTSSLQLDLGMQASFPNFPSERGPGGRTYWILAYTDLLWRIVPVSFEKALDDAGMNMAELNYRDQTTHGYGWAIGELNLRKDTTMLARCSDYFYIDDSSIYQYDAYGEHRAVNVIHLKKGPHRVYVNFYSPGGFFCEFYEDTQQARALVMGLPISVNDIWTTDVSDGTNPLIPLCDTAVSYVVKGVLASPHLGVAVINAAQKTLFLGDAKILDGPQNLEVEVDDTAPIAKGQQRILKLQLHQSSKLQCSGDTPKVTFTVALYPKGEGSEAYSPTKVQLEVLCREHGGVVAYPDFDGSIQTLWVEPPNITRFANRSCPATGCPVMLSLHGSDVDMWSGWGDTYEYTGPQANGDGFPYPAWLVQPSNRWRWGTDWEQQGFDNALFALQYVEKFLPLAPGETLVERRACCSLDSRKTLTTGHSMGGHGCEVYSTHFPDQLIGVGCASAWGSIGSYDGSSDVALLIDDTKFGNLKEVESEHDAEFLSANLKGVPMHAFYGSADASVPTTENKLMVQLVSSASGDPFAVPQTELPGVPHWFEQNVPEMVAFFEKSFKPDTVSLPQFPESFQFTITTPSTFGSRGNLKLVEKVLASRPSKFVVERCTSSQNPICNEALEHLEPRSSKQDGDPLWVVQTSNVQQFILELADDAVLGRAWPQALQLDGKLLRGFALNQTYNLCKHGSWRICSEFETSLPLPAGRIDMAMRKAAVCIIHGSGPGQESEALRLANKMYFISRYSVPIINAGRNVITDSNRSLPFGCDTANLIFIGSPSDNALTDCFKCAFPYVRFFNDPTTEISGFALGGHAYVDNRSAVMAVGILPTSMQTALLLHGKDAQALARAADAVPIASMHDFNDFMVFGPDYGWQGQGGLLASGFVDSKWRISMTESWVVPEHAVKAEFPIVEAPDGEDPSCANMAFWQRIRSSELPPGWSHGSLGSQGSSGMSVQLYALVLGVLSGISLPIGAWFGIRFSPVSDKVCGMMLAFGAGSLLFAVTVELYATALEELASGESGVAEMTATILGAFAGCAFFLILEKQLGEHLEDHLDEDLGEPLGRRTSREKAVVALHDSKAVRHARSDGVCMDTRSIALALFLGLLIDGVPEGILMGFMAIEKHLTPAFAISLCISNFPTAFASASLLLEAKMSTPTIIALWSLLCILVGCLSGLSCWLLLLFYPEFGKAGYRAESLPFSVLTGIAGIEGLTGGAMLGCISGCMLPEAFERCTGVKRVPFHAHPGFFCVSGFIASAVLKTTFG